MEMLEIIFPLNYQISWSILIGLFSVFIYWAFIQASRMDRMLNKFPGARSYPVLGHAYAFMNPEDIMRVLHEWTQKYGRRCRVYFGTYLKTLMVSDPEDFEKILPSLDLIPKSEFYNNIKTWLGEGLIISKGDRWHKHRKLLTPAFHFKILDDFQPIFDENAKVLVKILKDLRGKHCEMQEMMSRCTLDVICETAMGKKLQCQLNPDNEYLRATLRTGELEWMRFTKPWYQISFIWNLSKFSQELKVAHDVVHSFTAQVIKERKGYFSSLNTSQLANEAKDGTSNIYFNSKRRFAFLDLLLSHETSGELTEKDVQEETDTFMFAGHDTTATTLSWVIYMLGWHQSHQVILHEELDSIFGDDKSRPVEPQDLPNLKYLEMCIKETLRLYPPVHMASRAVTKDFQLDENSVIPKGAIINMNFYSCHRNPESFPQPEEFRPERFSPENRSNIHHFAFLPFSAGPRNCIGQRFAMAKVKTILANLFRNFHAQSLDPPDKVIAQPEMLLKARHPGIRMKFIPR